MDESVIYMSYGQQTISIHRQPYMFSWYYGPSNDFPVLPLCSIMEEVHVVISLFTVSCYKETIYRSLSIITMCVLQVAQHNNCNHISL